MSAAEIECGVVDVALLLRARTFAGDDGVEAELGKEVGTFDETTRPTGEQVGQHILQAAVEVSARINRDIEEDSLREFAKEVVALRAAMAVELSYIPEQTNPEDSIYDKLKELYESSLSSLLAALPDSTGTAKGFYSLRLRSDTSNVFPTSELLP